MKDDLTDTYVPVYGPVNSYRLPDFAQLDVRIDKVWVFDNWSLDLYLDIQNVYAHANQEGLQYNYDYTQAKPTSGLPILPILGIRAEF